MPAGRVHEPPDDRQKLVKLINSRDTAIGRRAACFVDRLDLGICSVDERRSGGADFPFGFVCWCFRCVVFGVLCFSPLSRGVSRAPKTSFHKLPEVGEYSYREKFVARWRERWGERWRACRARTNKPKSRASRRLIECPCKPNLLPVCLLICRVFWFLCQQIWFQPIFHFSSFSVPEVV
jgi:hypothetical protein